MIKYYTKNKWYADVTTYNVETAIGDYISSIVNYAIRIRRNLATRLAIVAP